ncbi:MAG: hypothetical protein KGP28_06920 [Bdellovibrionales bacterium]|nr:hypothetical protein [Bdellovibrionales bacterium]
MKQHAKPLSILFFFAILTPAHAYHPILRDFHSVRTAGMGDIRYTVGQFEENFFANPARSADNPENLFQLAKISLESGSGTLGTLGNLFKSGNGLSTFSNAVGVPLYARLQIIPVALHLKNFITDKWAMGVGLFFSAQTLPLLSNSGQIDVNTAISAGPVINVSRRLLEEDRLVVGANLRTQIRASSRNFSVQDFFSGTSTANAVQGGSGMGVDLDLGSTFRPHWKTGGFDYQLAFTINNVLGGKYTNLGKPIKSWPNGPFATNRSVNFGLSAERKDWIGLDRVIFGIESTDIGNNENGSFYRTLHLGAQGTWSVFNVRTGLNQGYFTAGFGVDLIVFSLNLATYGEELGLNPGIKQDRRYALDLGFKI